MQQVHQSKPSENIQLGILLGMAVLPFAWGGWLMFLAPLLLRTQSGWLSLGMVALAALCVGRAMAWSRTVSFGETVLGLATWLGWFTFLGLSILWLPNLTGRMFTILFPVTAPPAFYALWCHSRGKGTTSIQPHWFRKYGALMIVNIAFGHLFWFAAVLPLDARAFLLALGIVAGVESSRRLLGRD